MNALLLAVTLVLQTGDRIAVEGPVRTEKGTVLFRTGGLLYSVPAAEVLRIEDPAANPGEKPKLKLRATEEERKRLIEELEKNHSGQAPPRVAVLETPPPPLPAPDPGEEEVWRGRAREAQEGIVRARENVALLEERVSQLRSEIHTLFSLGYRPQQFTYQTTQLARTEEQIPYARLEVTRAERAWQQLREDARRAGILPGWLR